MTYSYSTKDGVRRYHYYVCSSAQKRGWKTCPSKSVPAWEIEQFVVEQIRSIGRDPSLIRETLAESQRLLEKSVSALEAEQRGLELDRSRWHKEIQQLAGNVGGSTARLADLQDRISGTERRMAELADELVALSADELDESDVVTALAAFDPVWESLTSNERVRLVHLLVARVNYDGRSGKVAVTFHPSGFKSLAAEPLKEYVA